MQRSTTLLCIALFAASCGSTNRWQRPHDLLAEAHGQLESGDYSSTVATAETLVGETSGDADDFELQRYVAFYLQAQGHLRASLGSAFAGGSNARTREESHLMAYLFAAGLADELEPAATSSSAEREGQALLPQALSTAPHAELVRASGERIAFERAVVLARLHAFEESNRYVREAMPSPIQPVTWRARLDELELPERLRPWADFMVFRALHAAPEARQVAYEIGISVLDEHDGYRLPASVRDDFVAWVERQPGKFKCPNSPDTFSVDATQSFAGTPRAKYVFVPD